MDFNKFFQSKAFKITLWSLGCLIVLLLVFKAGMLVGSRKTEFSYQWGENYHRNFAGPRGGFFSDFFDKNFIGAHGEFGQIIKIDDKTVVIKGRSDVEKIILIKNNTVIKRFQDAIKLTDLKADDYIVIIGNPNDAGQIEAEFIRLMPPPPQLNPNAFPPRMRRR